MAKKIVFLLVLMLGCKKLQTYDLNSQPTVPVSIYLKKLGNIINMSTANLVLDVSCDNIFGTNATGDWTMENISATTSVSLIQNKACQITLETYDDGNDTFTPVTPGSPLEVLIASDGTVSSASAVQYTNGAGSPTLIWIAAAQGVTTHTIVFNYANDAISATSSLSPNNLTGQTVSLEVDGISAPTVSSLSLYYIPALNSGSASYSLVASVSGSTGCKYIDNSGGTPPYTPTSWSSVNTAYSNGSAQTCPNFTPGDVSFSVGNWTSLWVGGTTTLLMWANTVNGMSSYTTANIGP